MRISFAVIGLSLLLPALASAQGDDRPQLSSTWRSQAELGPDNPTADPGFELRAGQYMDDATWRALDDHKQSYHFGLWTAEEVAALEALPGVQLATLSPVRGTDELGVVHWPDRVVRGAQFFVAIANADPGTDWILRAVGDAPESGMPPVDGPASAAVNPTASGFYRVHRVVGADSFRGRRAVFRAEKVEVNALELETSLRLTRDSVPLNPDPTAPQVLAAGVYTVRTTDQRALDLPIVVNLSVTGPSADLFTLEVLPAAGEPALGSSRRVRVTDQVAFRVLGPRIGGTFLDRMLPPGDAVVLEVQAEIVSFSNDAGEDLDLGLSSSGFSVAPGVPVVFPPARQAPRDVVLRSVVLEVWRPAPVPAAEPAPPAEE